MTPMGASGAQEGPRGKRYSNPLTIEIPTGGLVEICADPSVIHGQQRGDDYWYMFCTKDPLNDADRDASGALKFHNIPIFKSIDLVNWTYVGDVFSEVPSWGDPTSGLWAPEIQYSEGQYYLYYVMIDPVAEVSGEADCHFEPAIGVATSSSPTGPWIDRVTDSQPPRPVIESRRAGPGCNFYWTLDPEVITAGDGQKYIYYGSYFGGIEVRRLYPDGLAAMADTALPVAIPNRYENADVVQHDGYYYLFASATNCCNGPLTGYSVFAGRSQSPIGPFVDREGVSLLESRVGGTPVISLNGNRWVGPGHNTVFTDFSGQDWTIYHAIDRNDPYLSDPDPLRINKRHALLDPLDWIEGWPTVRGGKWASDRPQAGPAAQVGEESGYRTRLPLERQPGRPIERLSDEFDTLTLKPQWSWVREPGAGSYRLTGESFEFNTQAADLFVDSNDASVLTEVAPLGNYVVEARVRLDVPPEGCCFNYAQAGLVIYGDDDRFVKLTHVSLWETRQTEFAKELIPSLPDYPRYGNTVLGPPDEWTYLRIVKEGLHDARYTAYTSRDGVVWIRGGTWTHDLGPTPRIGLVSMGGSGFMASFDYLRVSRLRYALAPRPSQ
jgi:arabinan endo-1,5-alpha-L-arabinosidase